MTSKKTDIKDLLDTREDLSDFVFHFTKSDNAFEVLKSILKDNEIKDISKHGHICFTEAPLILLPQMFKFFTENENSRFYHKYMPYGIGIKKDYFYNIGGRPVIYGDKDDEKFLENTSLYWRFLYYNPNQYDWTWLREWRIKQASVKLDPLNMFVVLRSNSDREILFQDIFDIEFDGDIADGQFYSYATGVTKRQWSFKFISIEQIERKLISTKNGLRNNLESQKFEEIIDHNNLGSSGF